jgi:signal transduction histidine kinase
MFRRILLFVALLLLTESHGQPPATGDSTFRDLYQRYYQLYGKPDGEAEFYEASRQLLDYYRRHDKLDSYYKIRQNDVLYAIDHGRASQAIQLTFEILEEMKQDGVKYYHLVYTSLGTVYESRGNYRMAKHYYTMGLQNAEPTDSGALISIYSRLASLQSTREPHEAWQWNEKFGRLTRKYPDYQKIYYSLKGQIAFFMGDRQRFLQADRELQQYVRQRHFSDNYGIAIMQVFRHAFRGQYAEALALLDSGEMPELDLISVHDVKDHIFQLQGRYDLALQESYRRRDIRDSLNSDLLYDNINEVNARMGLTQLHERTALEREQMIRATAHERERWLAAVIVLLVVGLSLVVSRYLVRRRYQKRLLKKNRELKLALDHAQESDRMKTAFIQHVSHEIRTPLNVITGFAQIIGNSDFQIDDAERNQMLSEISRNSNEITDIVNYLLVLSDEASHQSYDCTETIDADALCREVMTNAEAINSEHLSLKLTNLLPAGTTLISNRHALLMILDQLMKNAIKFTTEGRIELKVRERTAHGGIEFTVADTGIGIDRQNQEKVFEPFFKVDPFKQGMGLGLTMARKTAELLGGTLTLDPSYTKGARFVVVLPE